MSYQTKVVPQYPPAGSSETSVTILTTVGNPGPQGPTGSKWFEGSGAPSSSLGNNFDFYLDDDTGDVYQKTSGSWSKVANIEGPTGPQGVQGPQGDKGWSPELAIVTDGARRVVQVVDWVGGAGTKPATGDYVGPNGLTSDISQALDVRGPPVSVWTVKTSTYNASAFDRILADTSGGAFTINLPSTPSTGDVVYFADGARTWHNFSLTVEGNGNTILGDTTFVANLRDESFVLVYNGTQWVLGIN